MVVGEVEKVRSEDAVVMLGVAMRSEVCGIANKGGSRAEGGHARREQIRSDVVRYDIVLDE